MQVQLLHRSCVRSSPDITNYDRYGPSDKCFEGKSSTQTCASGSKLCGGRAHRALKGDKNKIEYVASSLTLVYYMHGK